MFQIPVKEIIVNSDTQVVANKVDGVTPYASSGGIAIVANTGGLVLDGFHNSPIWATVTAAATSNNQSKSGAYFKLLAPATRIIKTAVNTGTAEVVTFTITAASGAQKGDVFRIVTDSIDLTPVQYQNRPTEKRYQLSAYCASANAIATELAAQITADPNSQVTATASTNVVTITAKKVGVKVGAYVGQQATLGTGGITTAYTVTGALAVSTAAVLPKGTYDALKNINWAKNFNIDQNINWMPLPGTSYNSYYFEVVSQSLSLTYGNTPYQNETHNSQVYGIRLYVATGLTLAAKMDLAVADANV